jgi:simple sugar transport system permease protein
MKKQDAALKKNNPMEALKGLGNREGFKSVMSSVVAVLFGIIIGFFVMLIASIFSPTNTVGDAFIGLGIIFGGPFSSGQGNILLTIGDTIFYAVPLILTGLSVAIAFKTGLFNIGAPGQYLMGALGSLLVVYSVPSTNRAVGILVWIVAILVGTLMGVVWGMIPGILKALFGINEVIVCIMTNWISANIVTWVFSGMERLHNVGSGKSAYLIKPGTTLNFTPSLGLNKIFAGSYIDIGTILAIFIAVAMWVIMSKTVLGYELKACGANRDAAKYAGLNEKKYIIIAMGIAGGLAAIGGCLYFLNPGIEMQYKSVYQNLPAYGFNGIPAALLANCNPIGVIFSALFIRYINAASNYLSSAGFNQYFGDIIVAIIIYLAGFSRVFKNFIKMVARWFKKKDVGEENKGGNK